MSKLKPHEYDPVSSYLHAVIRRLKKLCKEGAPGENGEALGFFIEATIEDGLLAVEQMYKKYRKELKQREMLADLALIHVGPGESIEKAVEENKIARAALKEAAKVHADCIEKAVFMATGTPEEKVLTEAEHAAREPVPPLKPGETVTFFHDDGTIVKSEGKFVPVESVLTSGVLVDPPEPLTPLAPGETVTFLHSDGTMEKFEGEPVSPSIVLAKRGRRPKILVSGD